MGRSPGLAVGIGLLPGGERLAEPASERQDNVQ